MTNSSDNIDSPIHHSPLEWLDFGDRPIESLAQVTKGRRQEWRRFFEMHRHAGIGPFCGPDIWIPWFFANPHRAPRIFEKRDSAGNLRAFLPLCWNGRAMTLACDTEFCYQELVADSLDSGVDLLLDVLTFCEDRLIRLFLGKTVEYSQLYQVLKHPAVREKAEVIRLRRTVARTDAFATTDSGKFALDSAYPARSKPSEIRHFAGGEITGSLLSEIAEVHRGTKGGNRYFEKENIEHFVNLQTRNTDRLILSTKRMERGDEIESYLMGYFENDIFHVVTHCNFFRRSPELLHHSIRHYFAKSEGPVFRVNYPGKARGENGDQIFGYLLFPRKNSSAAKVAGYRFWSKAKNLKQRLVRSS